MNILVIDNASIVRNGSSLFTGQHNGTFLKELISYGHRIIWFQNVQDNTKSISNFNLDNRNVKCAIASDLKGNKIFSYLKAYLRFLKYIRKTDFCYIYFPSSFKYCALICRLFHKPYGLYVRGMKDLDGVVSKHIIRHASIILTVGDTFSEKMRLTNRKGKIHTIRPMLDIGVDDIDMFKRDYCKSDIIKILYLGRIDPDKGIRELIESIKILNKKNTGKKYVLQIIGSGHFLEGAKQLAGNDKNIYFEGIINNQLEKKRYYREADIFILPTYHEGFPRTIYESLAYGTPILTTMVGGIPGLMKDGENCIEIKRESVEDIVEKVEFVVGNPQICYKLSSNGFEIFRKVFDKSRPSHARLLNDLL